MYKYIMGINMNILYPDSIQAENERTLLSVSIVRPYGRPIGGVMYRLESVETRRGEVFDVETYVITPTRMRMVNKKVYDSLQEAKMDLIARVLSYVDRMSVVGGVNITIAVYDRIVHDTGEIIKGTSEHLIRRKPIYNVARSPVKIVLIELYK